MMFLEKKCNTELEHRSGGCRRVGACRRHHIRFDEYGYDRRAGLGRRSSDDRRAGTDRRSSDKGLEEIRENKKMGVLQLYSLRELNKTH
jgi:hypothetical protein